MTPLELLTGSIPPPNSPISGNVARAKEILGDYKLDFPEEFWELASLYGMGKFFGSQIELLHPCSPGFVSDLMYRLIELSDVVEDYESGHGNDWLPLANVNEWALFKPAGDDPDYLFACLGGQGFFSVAAGIAKFIRQYPSVIMPQVFGESGDSLPNLFTSSNSYSRYPPPTRESIFGLSERRVEFGYMTELFDRLQICWPGDRSGN